MKHSPRYTTKLKKNLNTEILQSVLSDSNVIKLEMNHIKTKTKNKKTLQIPH